MTTATASTTAEAPKRGPGRPPKPKFANPEQRIPPAPTPRPDPDTFWEYWQAIEKEYPNRAVAYLYRGEPKIDRERLNKPKYIHSGNFFTREWLLDRWQSGEYLIILNDPYAPRAQQKLAEVIVRINDPTRPPVIEDLRELVMDYPGNKEYIAKLRLQGIQLPGESADVATTLSEIRESLRRPAEAPAPLIGNEIITSTVATLLQNNLDPARQMAMWREVIAMANRPQADNTAPMLTVMQAMLAQQQQQFQDLIAVLRQPQPAPASPPPPPAEDPIVSTLKERLLNKVVDQIENPAPAGGDGVPQWVMMVMPIAARAVEAFTLYLSQQPQPVPPPPVPIVPQTTAHPQVPTPERLPVLTQQTAPPPPPQPEQNGEHPTMMQAQQAAMLLNVIRPVLIQHLNAGKSGREFRDAILHLYGTAIYSSIQAQPGAGVGILRVLEQDAQFGPVCKQQPERMRAFVEEFLSDEEEDDEDEG